MWPKIALLSILLLSLFLVIPVQAEETADAAPSGCLYYFYGKDCPDCPDTNAYIDQMAKRYPGLNIQQFEVYYHKENHQMLQDYFTVYGVPERSQGLPAIFTSKGYFVGSNSLRSLLEQHIRDNPVSACPVLEQNEIIGIVGEGSPNNVLDTLTFATVTGAAYRDNFRIGGLTLVLILLGLMVVIKNDAKMLQRGFLFVLAVYAALFFFGIGYFSWLASQEGLSGFFHKAVGFVGIVFGLIKMKNFFDSHVKMMMPTMSPAWKIWLKKGAKWFLSPLGIVILGFMATLFVFPGVSSVFLSIRVLFADQEVRWVVLPLLLYYTFVFALRLIAIVLLLYFVREKLEKMAQEKGFSSDSKLELWRKHYWKVYQFVVCAAMLLIGFILLFW